MSQRLLPLPPFLFPFLQSNRRSAPTWSLQADRSGPSGRLPRSLARSMPLPLPHPPVPHLSSIPLLPLRSAIDLLTRPYQLIGGIGSRCAVRQLRTGIDGLPKRISMRPQPSPLPLPLSNFTHTPLQAETPVPLPYTLFTKSNSHLSCRGLPPLLKWAAVRTTLL